MYVCMCVYMCVIAGYVELSRVESSRTEFELS